jgi:biotin carboxyl carrier protein
MMSFLNEHVRDHSRQIFIVILGCVSLIAGPFMSGFASGQGPENKDGPPPALVEVATVIEKEVMSRITLLGTGEPWLETVVAAEEEGVVSKMNVEEGDRVKKGQVLCEQDTTQLKLELEESQYTISEAKILRNKAKREFERQQRLYKIDSVSEKAYEDAKFNYEASRKKVNQLRADRKNLEDQLRKKQIRAPVSGYVVKRQCQIGPGPESLYGPSTGTLCSYDKSRQRRRGDFRCAAGEGISRRDRCGHPESGHGGSNLSCPHQNPKPGGCDQARHVGSCDITVRSSPQGPFGS